MSRQSKKRAAWRYVGTRLEAPVFQNVETGEKIHVGTRFTDGNYRKVYPGEPSLRGHLFGKALQAALGTSRRD